MKLRVVKRWIVKFWMLTLTLIFAGHAFGAEGVTNKKLIEAQQDNQAWLTHGRNYAGWRYSPLDEITASNVARLTPQWIFQTGVAGKFQTTPLVLDGVMYITTDSNKAFAIDLLTGREIWSYQSVVPKGVSGCCGEPNRGFAVLGNKLFKVNYEGTILALDLKTGALLWETVIADYKQGFSATNAPLIVKDMVITGIAGAEFGTRDFIDAYDVETGKRRWRFWTVPGPGEPGHDTWGPGNAWERGGGSTWVTGTYDPELNLVYWGTGNPGPDMNGDDRPGDNLYTCAIVALNADTGELVWHYQFTPHDVHDWDAVADPVLVDIMHQGRNVKAVIQANRNGYFYALDRANGKFLFAKGYTEIDWADGIGSDGRPILVPGKGPTEEGNISCPGLGGGHNWSATSYSPQTRLYYFNSTDGCHIYYMTDQPYIEGQWYQASTVAGVPSKPQVGSVLAVNPSNGETVWRFEMVSSPSSGLLSTGGGLVFSGDAQGYFAALDARTGKPLWHFQTGTAVRSPAISYQFRGRQYIALAAGGGLIAFALPQEAAPR